MSWPKEHKQILIELGLYENMITRLYLTYVPTLILHYSSNAAAANWPLCFLCEHPPPLAIAIITTQFIRIG